VCTFFDDGNRFDCSPDQSSWSWILALTDVRIFDSGDPYNFRWKRSFIRVGRNSLVEYNVFGNFHLIREGGGHSHLTCSHGCPSEVWGFEKSLGRMPARGAKPSVWNQFEIGEALSQAIQVRGTAVKTVTGSSKNGFQVHLTTCCLGKPRLIEKLT
jgi:hypothetical protein